MYLFRICPYKEIKNKIGRRFYHEGIKRSGTGTGHGRQTGRGKDPDEGLRDSAGAFGCRICRGKDRIMEDLGCDSLDVVDIISSVEKTFQLKIPKETFIGIRTVDDLVNTVTANLKLR